MSFFCFFGTPLVSYGDSTLDKRLL
jgi:hypothetical protein